MTTDCKVTELFCIIDEFCKHFDAENAGNLLEDNSGVKRRRRAASLSDSEIIDNQFEFPTFRMTNVQSVVDALYYVCNRFNCECSAKVQKTNENMLFAN